MSDRLTLDPALDLWERQPGETPRKYGQFLTFRDQGVSRTLIKAAETLTLAYSGVKVTASRYRWQDRAAAWDANQSRLFVAEMEEERRRAAREDIRVLRVMTGMVGQALPHVQQQVGNMTIPEFTRFLDTTMKWRRNLFGDPTETIAVTGAGGDPLTVQVAEFQRMAPEQRRVRLAELAASVSRRVRAIDGDDNDEGDEGLPPLPPDGTEEAGDEDSPIAPGQAVNEGSGDDE
ncbi:hypothetical protein ACFRFL_14160 [Streptomyces sp. NPDC056708]|uniref:hypothetical protein n=1 Tax=unclassified Streptomyces TaxID=2593676 RepID=UPI0036AE8407